MAVSGRSFLNHVFAPTTSSDSYFWVADEACNPQDRAVSDAMDRRPWSPETAAKLSACLGGYTVMTFDLSRWAGGLEPVWTLLDPDSVQALSAEPSSNNRALRLAPDLDKEALGNSVLARNAGILLKEIAGGETLWMSRPSGCLMMKCVTRLRGLMAWPGLEPTEHFRKGKTYREQAVKELHLLRLLVEGAGLIRPGGLWFELTPLGRRMLEPGQRGALQALLFRHAFWHLDLSRFLPVYFPGELPAWWPQGQIGVILWGLSAVAEDWQGADTLTDVNRIALDGDRVSRVIQSPGGFTVEHDAVRGDLYLYPDRAAAFGPARAPATLYLGTEQGFTYRLSLSAVSRDSAQILIRNAAVGAGSVGSPQGPGAIARERRRCSGASGSHPSWTPRASTTRRAGCGW